MPETTGRGGTVTNSGIAGLLHRLEGASFSPLDLLPRQGLAEKLLLLELHGVPEVGNHMLTAGLQDLLDNLRGVPTRDVKVVVLGGGTGLSNIIGGDSRNLAWKRSPFSGMKELFPGTRAVVCVTDDGGSTGELLKDLPFVALGDIRHVLLSSLRRDGLQERYGLGNEECDRLAAQLYDLFNHRYDQGAPPSVDALLAEAGIGSAVLPAAMEKGVRRYLEVLFASPQSANLLGRPHCLGNLIVAGAMLQAHADESGLLPILPVDQEVRHAATLAGINAVAELLGCRVDTVLPCTTTPAGLQVLYTNGVLVSGEYKSGNARRGYPVDRVFVQFYDEPVVPRAVLDALSEADIVVLAPGSLFTSIIPILQVPAIADTIRANRHALKILVTNLWVQKGETDLVHDAPGRRFYVSDLLTAYHRNIPGGVRGLFDQVLALGLEEISANILQRYAVEDKVPIYLDRERVGELGFQAIEAGIYSRYALQERGVLQHDPHSLARSVRTLWALHRAAAVEGCVVRRDFPQAMCSSTPLVNRLRLPSRRWQELGRQLSRFEIGIDDAGLIREGIGPKAVKREILDILWRHPDIPESHFDNLDRICLVDPAEWHRCQQWDNVFSFYEPERAEIKIRADVFRHLRRFEIAFLVALGQSVLGVYAGEKTMTSIEKQGEELGKVYNLRLLPLAARRTALSTVELHRYLELSRMVQSQQEPLLYTRLVNGQEGFTPPGLLFGLTYAWYLDNRHVCHIEYKMSVIRTHISDLIPEQMKILGRRQAFIDFFRTTVFRLDSPLYDEACP